MLKSLVFLAASATTGLAGTVKYDWNIEWVNSSPDGVARPVIGINGKWPLPTVEGTVGDTLIVNIHNKLGNESTSIHWHGLHQIDTPHMDGASSVTQCAVPPGESFEYKFKLDQAGTYWYHSHTGAQYPDGLRGPLIVKHKDDPYKNKYDKEYLLTVSDWYRDQVPTLLANLLSSGNPQGQPPRPVAALINDAANSVSTTSLKFEPGKKYKIRVVNMSALTSVFLFLEDHDLEVIEIDSVDVKATKATKLYITPAQRYSFIVKAKETKPNKNYAIGVVFDTNPDWRTPIQPLVLNATASMQYDANFPFPAQAFTSTLEDLLDDVTVKPLQSTSLGAATKKIDMEFNMGQLNGIPRGFVNGKPYVHQKVPTLYSVLSSGSEATNPDIYGAVNPFFVSKNDVVELVVFNKHRNHHPFHFHGHHFQVCSRGAPNAGPAPAGLSCDDSATVRDTVDVYGNSYAVLRFKADNAGVWLFHCHIEWHVPMGMSATIIEDALGLQKSLSVPPAHFEVCKAGCQPFKGNAGGNTSDLKDMSNANPETDVHTEGALFVPGQCPVQPNTSATASQSTWTSNPTGTRTGMPTGTATITLESVTSKPTSWAGWTTSTLYSTQVITVTSCKPDVTNCPNKPHVTTAVVPYTTTVCPVGEDGKPISTLATATYVKPPQFTGGSNPHDDDDYGMPQGSGGFGKPDGAGGFGKPQGSGDFGKPDGAGGFGTPQGSGDFGKPNGAGDFGKPQGSGDFGKPQGSGDYAKPQGGDYAQPQGTDKAAPWAPGSGPANGAPAPTSGNIGTAAPTPTSTGKGMVVTAGAAKRAGGFGAAAIAGVLVAALA